MIQIEANYLIGQGNLGGLDVAIANGTVSEFWDRNPDVWEKLFPGESEKILRDLQDGYTTLKMYSVQGDRVHIYVTVDPRNENPVNY